MKTTGKTGGTDWGQVLSTASLCPVQCMAVGAPDRKLLVNGVFMAWVTVIFIKYYLEEIICLFMRG